MIEAVLFRSMSRLMQMLSIALLAPLFLAPMETMASEEAHLVDRHYIVAPSAPKSQSEAQAQIKSEGCMSCHAKTDRHTMHVNPAVIIGCVDCHGGNAAVKVEVNVALNPKSKEFKEPTDNLVAKWVNI
jgi:mono/diheme cytochrome c family protein